MLLLAILFFAISGMSPRPQPQFCTVVNGAKLPADIGGATGFCTIVRNNVGTHAGGKARITVRVLSVSRLVTSVRTARGETLPDQHFAVSDKSLSRRSVAQFAQSIATILDAQPR